MFFDSWANIARIILIGIMAYAALIVLLRLTGKRTLSKMNAFDFVVTVALGSILATILLSKSVTLADGVTALCVLIGLQYVIAWLAARFTFMSHLVKSEPTLVVYQGHYLYDAIKAQRLTPEEVRSAIRNQGIANVEDVASVVLETEGSLTVIPCSDLGRKSALVDVADQIAHLN
ncbi:MAG: DUF421 domain-containing protein [Anaerolineae bacterium]|nr:DUF421 domain-containing protein [Anaerolineae bacterium]